MKIKFLLSLFIFIFTLPFTLTASTSVLKKHLLSGKSGDYIILAKGRSFSCLSMQKSSPDKIFIEEIFFPHLPKNINFNSIDCAKNSALLKQFPNIRTSFCLSEDTLDASTSSETDINLSYLINTLLSLSFTPLPIVDSISSIPVVIENNLPTKTTVNIFESYWPIDNSPLSGRKILIYLANPEISPFPVRIIMDSPRGRITIRCINLGHNN